MLKTLQKLVIEGNFLKLIKGIYKKYRANKIFNGKIQNVFLLKQEAKQ